MYIYSAVQSLILISYLRVGKKGEKEINAEMAEDVQCFFLFL